MTNSPQDLLDIKRISEGDEEAFTGVYNLYWERVYGFAYRMLGVQNVAEDVTHEAFLVLIQHPNRYSPERSSMLTFLCSVARNCIFNHFRRCGYETNELFDEDVLIITNTEDKTDPLSTLLEQELSEKLNEAISKLPAFQREVLILREFQELSYDEISIVVGVETNVIKARLHRARQNLAKRLAPYLVSKGERYYEL